MVITLCLSQFKLYKYSFELNFDCLVFRFKVFADYEDYIKCQDKVSALYKVCITKKIKIIWQHWCFGIFWLRTLAKCLAELLFVTYFDFFYSGYHLSYSRIQKCITVRKFGVSNIRFLKEMNTWIQQSWH